MYHIFFKFRAKDGSPAWEDYLDYVDEIVVNGLLKALASSIGYLLDETDPNLSQGILFEIKLELQEPDVIFNPPIDKAIVNNFSDQVNGFCNDIFYMSELVPRVAAHQTKEGKPNNYLDVMENHKELKNMKDTFLTRIQDVLNKANKLKTAQNTYSYIWTDSRTEYMHYFLTYSRQLTADEVEMIEEDDKLVKKQYPSLAQFQEQIDFFENLHDDLKMIENFKTFQGWFKVDLRPFRISLLNNIKRWSYAFKKHLMDHVVKSLGDLNDFIERADEGLMAQVQENDYQGLIRVMEFLQSVKERQTTTDHMFEPLEKIIELLRNYGVPIPEESIVQLQELPEKWANTKRLSVIAIQQVAPLQALEVTKLRKKIGEFDTRQADFRTKFLKMRFFKFQCKKPYEFMGAANDMICSSELEMEKLQDSATLFEVQMVEFRMLQLCRKEIRMLKQIWDYIFLVKTSVDQWKTTPWKDIDVENMDMECKKFSKDIRGLDKEMRTWDVFNGLEVTVKNMLTSLRAVGELQNPAIRDRHWNQLVIATKVDFIMTEDTTLADLLDLNLHNYEDEVHNIVDKAIKEMAMERMLKELEVIWSAMEFQNEKHARTGYTLLRTSEELIETLEENQVQIQNMMTSKYISYFIEEISAWQKKLSIVDTVISLWFDVQRTWSHLESIFIGSEDIRRQLPVDSKRFDDIDEEFKGLMKKNANTLNVVRATNVPGLAEKLEVIQSQLALCEKALAEYLETKRLAFPRFYFASSTDLLDILSNGNQPIKVAKHLTKLFDSMAKLKLRDTGKDIETEAYCMIAKDGEEVDFYQDCVCEGQVEVWLNRLMYTMRESIRRSLSHAVKTYEVKPRDQWLFDYPAQVSLCGTQIWWTSEVGIAFGKFEEGYENAIRDYYKKQIAQLNNLITLLLGSLTKGDRQKVMTICTIDVHSRDVVGKLITSKIESVLAFMWQSQLRHRFDYKVDDCFTNICDAQFRYWHEYLGNTARLVITPLTDRCYITLTQVNNLSHFYVNFYYF